ncbi:MAG: hypothetical protein WKF88_05650 [Ferruginibacter sp.]
MDQTTILQEVKKATDLWMDKTYTVSEFYSHILAIIRDNSDTGEKHKEQLERLLFKVDELRENQRLFHGGHRSKLGLCRKQETEMDKKVMYLVSKGYTFDRYKNLVKQEDLFRG